MAGLFDFKSAEDILQERRTATKANQQQLLNSIVAAAPKESRQASMLGAQLGMAIGNAMGTKAKQEQLTDVRDMGKTIEEIKANKVAGGYSDVVEEEAENELNRRLGLLSDEMQQSEKVRIGMERTPEDLDLVGRQRYMAKVLQDAGMTSRAAQFALLADKEAQRQLEIERKYKFDEEKAEAAALTAAKDRTERFNIDLGKQTVDLEEGLAGLIAIKGVFKDVESGKVDIDKIDLPGIGLYDRTKQDNRTREVKGIVQGLQNVILKARSGGAVTESEADRLLVEAQQLRTEKDVYQFYKRIETEIDDKLTKVVGSYPQDIQDSYYARTKANNTPPPSGDEDGTTSGGLTSEAAAFIGQ